MSSPRARLPFKTDRPLKTDRLTAFSDGVLAIAATLLVLEIAVQPPGTLLQQVLAAWPGYLAYAVSFLTIGATWLAHTALTDRLTGSDPILLQLNLVLLLVVAFLPFPTRLVIDTLHDTGDERVAVTMYGLTLLAIRLLAAAMDAYARHERLYSAHDEGEELPTAQQRLLPAVIGYAVVILIGLVFPRVAVTLYFFVAIYLIVPFGEMARLLVRRS
jgi:uncharacterized membrane protein